MSAPGPLPDPAPGQRWIGGTNGGHPLSQVVVLRVTKTKVRIRFVGGKYHDEQTWVHRYQFVVQFRPDVSR